MRTLKTMFKIESRPSVWGMNMVISALCMPVVVVPILGIIFGDRFAYQGVPYTFSERFLGALSTIAVRAGGVMGLPLLVSNYRQKHILKRFQITPISPTMILAVHVIVYAVYPLVSLVLAYASIALLLGYHMQGFPVAFPLRYILIMLSMFNIDVMMGGIVPDMKSISVTVSVLYFPMLVSSGTILPYEMTPEPIQKATGLMPLIQEVKLLRVISLDQGPTTAWIPMAVIAGMFLLCNCINPRFFRWEQFYPGKEIRHARLPSFLPIIKSTHKGEKATDICLQAAGEVMQGSCFGGVQGSSRGTGSYRFWLIKRILH